MSLDWGARRRTLIVLSPRRFTPAAWVRRPIFLPAMALKPSASSTSMPSMTGGRFSGGGSGLGGSTTTGAGGLGAGLGGPPQLASRPRATRRAAPKKRGAGDRRVIALFLET